MYRDTPGLGSVPAAADSLTEGVLHSPPLSAPMFSASDTLRAAKKGFCKNWNI